MRAIVALAGLAFLTALSVPGNADPQVVAVSSMPAVPGTDHILVPGVPGPNPASCAAVAPAGCSTGVHLSMYSMTIGFPGFQPGYTGTTEVKVTWVTALTGQVVPGVGAQVFRCNFINGNVVSCVISPGSLLPAQFNWPPPGTLFEHTCSSYALGTTTPGGVGTYSCFVSHI